MISRILLALLLFSLPAFAAERITATVTLTNLPSGPTDTITINGSVRTWTNSIISSPSTLIKETNSIPLSATNLLNHLSLFPSVAGQILSQSNPTNVLIAALPGRALTITSAGGWADITYTTNTTETGIQVRVPISIEAATNQTNIASLLVLAQEKSTNAFSTNATALTHYVTEGASAQQSIASPLRLLDLSMARLRTNQFLVFTNGSAWSYLTADTNGYPVLRHSTGVPLDPLDDLGFINLDHVLTLQGAAEFFPLKRTNDLYGFGFSRNTWLVANTWTNADNVFQRGFIATNALSYLSKTTNGVNEGSTNSNQRFTGTNAIASRLDFNAAGNSSLANGNNAGVILGSNVFLKLSGPSAAYVINGMAAEHDGSFHIVECDNPAISLTIANASGTDPTAANRIITGTGGDVVLTNNPAFFQCIYNSAASRWRIISFSR